MDSNHGTTTRKNNNNNTANNTKTTSHNTHNTQTHQKDIPFPNHDTNSDFGYAPYYTAHAKLAAIIMNTVRTVYAGKDTTTTLFTKVQQRVRELKAWVDDLPACLHMDKGMNNPPSTYYHDYDLLSLHLNLNQVCFFFLFLSISPFSPSLLRHTIACYLPSTQSLTLPLPLAHILTLSPQHTLHTLLCIILST